MTLAPNSSAKLTVNLSNFVTFTFDNFEIDLLIISTLSSTLKITFFIEPE